MNSIGRMARHIKLNCRRASKATAHTMTPRSAYPLYPAGIKIAIMTKSMAPILALGSIRCTIEFNGR